MKRSELIPGQVYVAKDTIHANHTYLVMAKGKRAEMKYIHLPSDSFQGHAPFNDSSYTFEPADSLDAAWLEACIAAGHTVRKSSVKPKLENYPIW